MKCNEWAHKQTFKEYDLQQYIKTETQILLFYGLGKKNCDLGVKSKWAWIGPESQQKMLDNIKVYNGGRKWGFKNVVVVYDKDFNKYFQSNDL